MRVQLFGVGTKSTSPAITAQKRVNCYVEARREADRTQYVLVGRPARRSFADLGAGSTRGMWAVNTLATPLLFVVKDQGLYSVNNSSIISFIGNLSTTSGDVSMADDGTYLVIVDGSFGYVYNMSTGVGPTQIVDGNFTTTPQTVTWQDQYFIVTASGSRQFQMSQIGPVDPTIWPAVQINFAGSGAGNLRNGLTDHSVLHLFGDVYTEFWQDTGAPDFPFALIPGSAQQFGLAAAFSLAQFDNSVFGLFQDRSNARNISRLAGFNLQKISDVDIDNLLGSYSSVADGEGYAFTIGGHPFYLLHLHQAGVTLVFDGLSGVWSEWTDSDGAHFAPHKLATLQGRLLVGNEDNGLIEFLDPTSYEDVDGTIPLEVISKHIWQDDKYIGITQLQIDIESGVGTGEAEIISVEGEDVLSASQGYDPVIDLQVSKDGGNTFYSVGFSKMGKLGEFTQRVIWTSLGGARDWVLKFRITDPVKRIITGASMEAHFGRF